MTRTTIGYLAGRGKRAPAVALALLATFVATALAAGNSVQAKAPNDAKACRSHCSAKHELFSIRLSGNAQGTKTLYMFVDYKPCGSTPATEHYRHRANGNVWTVHGQFSKTSKGWFAPAAGPDHVCAYLVEASEPFNPKRGVVAHDFVTFTVHQ